MNGIVSRRSQYSFDETVDRLLIGIGSKGAKLFSVVDHAREAMRAGLTMRPTKLLIFGSPSTGTPLMLATPSLAIDLPQKILVWQEPDGSAWTAYNTAEYLADRHGVSLEQSAALAAADSLTSAVTHS